MLRDICGKPIDEMNEYLKGCSAYPDGTIRDASGKVVGGIDVDSETYKEIFGNGRVVGFTIKD